MKLKANVDKITFFQLKLFQLNKICYPGYSSTTRFDINFNLFFDLIQTQYIDNNYRLCNNTFCISLLYGLWCIAYDLPLVENKYQIYHAHQYSANKFENHNNNVSKVHSTAMYHMAHFFMLLRDSLPNYGYYIIIHLRIFIVR